MRTEKCRNLLDEVTRSIYDEFENSHEYKPRKEELYKNIGEASVRISGCSRWANEYVAGYVAACERHLIDSLTPIAMFENGAYILMGSRYQHRKDKMRLDRVQIENRAICGGYGWVTHVSNGVDGIHVYKEKGYQGLYVPGTLTPHGDNMYYVNKRKPGGRPELVINRIGFDVAIKVASEFNAKSKSKSYDIEYAYIGYHIRVH